MTVLIRRGIVDEMTIAAVRRQFRELVREGTKAQEHLPPESRVFDSECVFHEMARRGQVKHRDATTLPGSREGRIPLIDFGAEDGGYAEWVEYHWSPLVEAGLPPKTMADMSAEPELPVAQRYFGRVVALTTGWEWQPWRFFACGGSGRAAAAPAVKTLQ